METAPEATGQRSDFGIRWDPKWLGGGEALYTPKHWRSPQSIKVNRFRQIFLWPLALSSKVGLEDGVRETVEALRDPAMRGIWDPVHDLFSHAGPASGIGLDTDQAKAVERGHRYGEFVYYHDFIQGVLYRDQSGKKDPPISLLRRKGIGAVEAVVKLHDGEACFRADVDRLNLYVFATGALVLALEVHFGAAPSVKLPGPDGDPVSRPMSLADAQTFIDQFRRAYAPFFQSSGAGPEWVAARVPQSVRWLPDHSISAEAASKDSTYEISKPPNLDGTMAEVNRRDGEGRRFPPLFQHWAKLIAPLSVANTRPEGRTSPTGPTLPVWRHVVDERIPAMSYISLTGSSGESDQRDLLAVSRGDWIRLCYADPAGGDPLPYSPEFLADFEHQACYDRFFPSGASDGASRYMFAGYHLTAVGAGWFFDDLIVHHFRRHYFQMGLTAHMEKASLLATSSRITEAVQARRGDLDRAAFEATILAIQQQFIEFMHLFRFGGMSNQLQAAEMHAMWRKTLGLSELFDDVKKELEAATQFIFSSDQKRQADSAGRLNLIALFGVVLGLAFAALSMNVLITSNTPADVFRSLFDPQHLIAFGGSLALFSGIAWIAARLFANGTERPRRFLPSVQWVARALLPIRRDDAIEVERSIKIAVLITAIMLLIGLALVAWGLIGIWVK